MIKIECINYKCINYFTRNILDVIVYLRFLFQAKYSTFLLLMTIHVPIYFSLPTIFLARSRYDGGGYKKRAPTQEGSRSCFCRSGYVYCTCT